MYLPFLIKLDAQIMNGALHMQVIFIQDQLQYGRLVANLVVKKKTKNPDVEYVLNHFSDMHGPILFNRGTSAVHNGIH